MFITLPVYMALSSLADKAYQVITGNGKTYNFSFLGDGLFINNTYINAFTPTIAVITSFFDEHLTANPDEEVTVPDAGTGDVVKPEEGTEGEDDAALYVEAALAARDQEIERICALSNTQRDKYVAVAAGYNKTTGQVTVGAKIEEVGIRTYCVEDIVADQLIAFGANLEDIVMTPAIRSRTMEIIPVCKFCQLKYTRDNFLPGTPFE